MKRPFWIAGLAAAWVAVGSLGGLGSVLAAEVPHDAPKVSARAVELLDGSNGHVVYSKNASQELPMASVTKLMTLYLAVRAVEHKKVSLQSLVPVSDEAYRTEGSQIWLEPGERLTVDQMLKGIAIGSANDAAYALGEYLAGSPEAFVEEMNRTARSLGMTSTHFVNPHGLPAKGHYTTAHDLGILAAKAVRQPLLLHFTSMREDRSIRNGKGGHLWLINHNRMLGQYAGMDGLKTGFTTAAGFCMVATARRGDTRMIAVVLGAPSSKARFHDASSLMTWGFQHFQSVRVARRDQVMGRVAVRRGESRAVNAVVTHDHTITVEPGHAEISTRTNLPSQVMAPVQSGQPLGRLEIWRDHTMLATFPLVADHTVAAEGWMKHAWRLWWTMAG